MNGIEKRTASSLGSNLGRHVFGAASLATGLITLAWRNYNQLHQLRYILCAAAAAQVLGGAAIQFRRLAKTGALVLGAAYLVFVLTCVPPIIAKPLIFWPWGNFFIAFSLLTGAAIVYASLSSSWAPETVNRIGCILLGVCAVSSALYQVFALHYTASLVPKWIPPSQMFWTVATTVFFALAGVALLANRRALLAARLETLMLVMFGLLVWLPLNFLHPHSGWDWHENAGTLATAGAVWILADLLGAYRPDDHRPR